MNMLDFVLAYSSALERDSNHQFLHVTLTLIPTPDMITTPVTLHTTLTPHLTQPTHHPDAYTTLNITQHTKN